MTETQYLNLNSGGDEAEVLQLESLCVNCNENGTTSILFTDIPHWRQVVVMAFECSHCHFKNNELKPAGAVAEKGLKIILTVDPESEPEVLTRQIVKSEYASVSIPQVELEIPGSKGQLTTVEGIINNTIQDLQMGQEDRRRYEGVQAADAIDQYCQKLKSLIKDKQVFSIILDDPAGNSFISTNVDPLKDPKMVIMHYDRSIEQTKQIGLSTGPEQNQQDPHHGHNPRGVGGGIARIQGEKMNQMLSKYTAPEEVMSFPGKCYTCGADCDTRMFQTTIPYFKDIIVMSNACEVCGYRNSEIKSNTGISEKGNIITLKVENGNDLRRDLIKSETAEVTIPELDLSMTTETLGGLVSTVEGLITQIRDKLGGLSNFHLGDSAEEGQKGRWKQVIQQLEDFATLKNPWTLILKDPLSNTFIAPDSEQPELDRRLKIESYDRSEEEEERLGILELKNMEMQNQEDQN